MSTVSNVSNTQSGAQAASQNTKKDELGKNDFLKLLVTQLKYQDPMKPMEDKEFIAQMAQFSSLEQMQNMNTAMLTTQATALIGKNVSWTDEDGIEHQGKVDSVKLVNGQPNLLVGDIMVEMDSLVGVTQA